MNTVSPANPRNHLLTRARFNKGFSMRALAQRAGISTSWLVELEVHGRQPGPDVAKRVADVLDLKPTDLFDLPLPGDDQEPAAA